MKLAHIYASNAKFNSGDFMIGVATKRYFVEQILNMEYNKNIEFKNFDCRNKNLFNTQNINYLNQFDYIIVGGGGLILPDSNPNKISCWQWSIPESNYKLIKKPIYVISIGYNTFYNQNMLMPNRDNNKVDKTRLPILKSNLTQLLECSTHFTMRHNEDITKFKKLIDNEELSSKVNLEICPTVWYATKFWKQKINKVNQKYIAIEIKDDRPNRRYYNISKSKFYNELMKFVIYCQKNKKLILYLSHDGSKSFYKYLKNHKINIPYLDNSCANALKIRNNYEKIHTILCSAGHSQMISYGMGIETISLVSHPKLYNFCQDMNLPKYIEINKEKNIYEKLKQFIL